MATRVFDAITWGHDMVPTELPGSSECSNCGIHFADITPCPSSPVCECVSNHREGFTCVGILGLPIFVCAKCRFPTRPVLEGAISYLLRNNCERETNV